MNASASLISIHLAGEGKDEISLDTLSGKFSVSRTEEVLTPYGGLAGWRSFLKHLGIIERLDGWRFCLLWSDDMQRWLLCRHIQLGIASESM
jgi:hypothetical protein